MGEPVPSDLLPFCARLAVVAEGVDGQSASWQELSPYLDIGRVHKLDKVVHYDVYAVLVEIAVVAEAEKIELERLTLDHFLCRDIGNVYRCKIGLTCDRAKGSELGTVEFYKVVTVRVLVIERFEQRRVVFGGISYAAFAQVCKVLGLFISAHCYPPRLSAGSLMPFAAKAFARSMQVPQHPHGFSPPS